MDSKEIPLWKVCLALVVVALFYEALITFIFSDTTGQIENFEAPQSMVNY